MKPLIINVTQADIDTSTRGCPNNCVLAKAVLREHPDLDSVNVLYQCVAIYTQTRRGIYYDMTDVARSFISRFDSGEDVESCLITLPYRAG